MGTLRGLVVGAIVLYSVPGHASPDVVGYAVIGGDSVDDSAAGSKALYVTTRAGDEMKVKGVNKYSLGLGPREVTYWSCNGSCRYGQPPILVMIEDELYEGQLFVIGKGFRGSYPLNDLEEYTAIGKSTVRDVKQGRYGGRVLRVMDGKSFSINGIGLDPMVGDDVVFFSKTIEFTDPKTNKVRSVTLFKALVDWKNVFDLS